MTPALTMALLLLGATDPSVPKPGSALTTQGNRILLDGQPFQIRGVAIGDPVTGRSDRPIDDFRVLARDWKANAVRISIHPFVWKRRKAEALRFLDRDVQGALSAGLIPILVWHTIGWPDGGYQIPTWQGAERDEYDSNLNLARDFWTTMTERYGADGRIVFELWNEPASFDPDGKPLPNPGWQKLRPSLDSLLTLIRQNSKNLVLATGGQWAYDLRGIKESPLEGPNVAYAWHVYAGHDQNNPVKWDQYLDGLDQTFPVLITEWGFQRDSKAHYNGTAESFARPFFNQYIQNGRTAGWIAWIWHPHWGPPMLEPDWRTPNEFGRFVKAALAHPGQVPSVAEVEQVPQAGSEAQGRP